MSQRAALAHEGLTTYEAEQLRQIAAWKSEPTNPLSELWKMISLPVARAVETVIPEAVVRSAIERSYDASELIAGRKDIQRQAGVKSIRGLRGKPLEECDRLAKQVGQGAQMLATAEGAATGAGGALTTLVDVPILFILALRTILKIGYCYGYPLDQPRDRPFVVGVLIARVPARSRSGASGSAGSAASRTYSWRKPRWRSWPRRRSPSSFSSRCSRKSLGWVPSRVPS
jgi:hypothetical protein